MSMESNLFKQLGSHIRNVSLLRVKIREVIEVLMKKEKL